MSLLGILVAAGGLAGLCWLIVTAAIYALPAFVGTWAAVAAFHAGAGYAGAALVALMVGTVIVLAGRFIFVASSARSVRAAIGLLYALPAAVAGYEVALALAQIGSQSEAWRIAFGIVGGTAVAATVWFRLAGSGRPMRLEATRTRVPGSTAAARRGI